MTGQPQWEPTAAIPPAFDRIEPQTPTPRSTIMPTPPPPDKTVIRPEDAELPADILDVSDPDNPDCGGNHFLIGDQIEHPDEGSGAPISVEAIKDAIAQRVNDAAVRLDALRKDRDQLNANVKELRGKIERDIKASVLELAEAKRIANALAPRKPRARKAAK